jgi:hypothetical protein
MSTHLALQHDARGHPAAFTSTTVAWRHVRNITKPAASDRDRPLIERYRCDVLASTLGDHVLISVYRSDYPLRVSGVQQ